MPWSDGARCHDLVLWICWVLSQFSFSFFTFIKRLFSSSLLSAIRLVSSAYLRLLIFLPAILIPACSSSSPTFHMMFSAHKLNKQGDDIQPWHTPFPIWNQSVVWYSVLTIAFLTCIQISLEASKVFWHSHHLKNVPQFVVIYTVTGFGVVNRADVFLKPMCFFNDPVDVGNLISSSFAFYKSSLNIWKFTVHVLLKPGLENFEHYFASVWDECNCAVVCTLFDIAFLWDWNENWTFPVLWPLLNIPYLQAYWVQHFHSIIF